MEGWKQYFDAEGYAYYNNAATGETLWEQEYNERLEQMKQEEAPPPPPPAPPSRVNPQIPSRNASSPAVNNGGTLRPYQRGNESTSAPSSVATSPNIPHPSPQIIPPKANPPPVAKPSPNIRPGFQLPPQAAQESAPAPLPRNAAPSPVPRPNGRPSPQPSFSSSPESQAPAIPMRTGPAIPPKKPAPALPPPKSANNINDNDYQRPQLTSSNPIPVAPRVKQSFEPPRAGSAPGRPNEASIPSPNESDKGGSGSAPKSGGSSAKSIIEQKLKADFKPNYQLKTMGSHISIGLPTAVVQTGGFASENFSWAMNGSLIMQGELLFERAGDWQPRYCMIEEGTFQLYKSSMDQLPEMSFPLKGCTYDLNLGTNRSHAWNIKKPDGVSLNLSANSKPEFEHWSSAIKINGAKDGPLVQADKAIREKKIKDAERRQEKEYVEAKKKDILTFNQNQQSQPATRAQAAGLSSPADAVSNISIEDLSGELFKIRVTFDHQTWFIYRTEKEMSNLYSALVTSMLSPVRLDNLRGIYPKKQKGQELKPMVPVFDSILNQLNNERRRIFADKNLRYHYSRFFGPIKMGDTKPPGFVMPFEIELS